MWTLDSWYLAATLRYKIGTGPVRKLCSDLGETAFGPIAQTTTDSVVLFSKELWTTLLPSATKLRRLCFYTCLSFCSQGGGVPQCMLAYHYPPRSRHPPEADTPPGADPCWTRHPPGSGNPPEQTPWDQAPPWEQTPRNQAPPSPQQTATVADGTHPTGMHFCLLSNSNSDVLQSI